MVTFCKNDDKFIASDVNSVNNIFDGENFMSLAAVSIQLSHC